MAFNAFLTLGAIVYGVTRLLQASPDTLVVEAGAPSDSWSSSP